MRFEMALALNYRRHQMMVEDGGKGLFKPQDARELSQTVARLLRGEFIPLARMNTLFIRLGRIRDSYPYRMDAPEIHNNPYGRRETVREACEVGGRLMLIYSCKGPTKVKEVLRIPSHLKGYGMERIGDMSYTFIDCNHENINALRANRWHVESKSMDKPVPLVDAPEGLDSRLYPYQVEGVRMLMTGYRLLADEQGLGKTAQTAQFVKEMGFQKVLICCPASLKYNWKKELIEWGGASEKDVDVISGTKKAELDSAKFFFVINYDILANRIEDLSAFKWDLVVADECQKIQSETAKRTQAFLDIPTRDRLFISGTPFTSRPMQMFTALHAIAPKVFANSFNYGMQFCDPTIGHTGRPEFKGASNMGTLHKILMNGICIRRLKSEVLDDLPEKTRVTVPLMTEESKLKKDKAVMTEIAELEDKAENQKNAYGPFEYLKQISYLKKRDAVIEWIENFLESGKKLVVFAIHKRTIADLMDHFGKIAVKVDGSTPDKARETAKERFQTDPDIRLFVGNVQAAGTGITLTAASDTCTVELGWLASDHLQAEDRVHRVGQKNSVMSYYLVCPDSIDMTLMSIINKKAKVHGAIFDDTEDNMLKMLSKMDLEKVKHGSTDF